MALRLGDILIEQNIINEKELEIAINEHQREKEFLGQTLVRMGLITERRLLEVLSKQQGIPFEDLSETEIEKNAIDAVPPKFAWHYKIMPVRLAANVLTVATSNSFDMWPIDDLETNLGYRVEIVLSVSTDIMDAIKKHYGVGSDTVESLLASASSEEEAKTLVQPKEKVEDLSQSSDQASVVKLVNQILQQAIHDRATDIHFELLRSELILRYRVDGILYDTQISENIKYLYPAIVSRIKVMSNLDIVERRIPQDGRASVKVGEAEYELRISIIPTLHGENIVIRVLPTMMLFGMKDLGMTDEEMKVLNVALAKPHGIIFVTGPTGSGKSTTLYTCLSKLNTRARKIITIEDPVEYELRGISQIQVSPKVELTFSTALRSVLRHDPDIIMVGEVRDVETAKITIQTALTGHLVFSTLHTNEAAGGITRLINMGVDPFLIASSVEMFIAQRLVRTICVNCKEEVTANEAQIKAGISQRYYRGKGCKECNNTGYKGRAGIYELLPVQESIKQLIMECAPSNIIEKKSRDLGMKSLRYSGLQKVAAGLTTPEEVDRVTQVGGEE